MAAKPTPEYIHDGHRLAGSRPGAQNPAVAGARAAELADSAPTGGPNQCIANNGSNGEPEVPLWECPCKECTRLDWEMADDDRSLSEFRSEHFPEHYDTRPEPPFEFRPANF